MRRLLIFLILFAARGAFASSAGKIHAHCEFLLVDQSLVQQASDLLRLALNKNDELKLNLANTEVRKLALEALGLRVLPPGALATMRLQISELKGVTEPYHQLRISSGFVTATSLNLPPGPMYAWADSGLERVEFEIALRMDFAGSPLNFRPKDIDDHRVGLILADDNSGRHYLSATRLGPEAFMLELGLDVPCAEMARYSGLAENKVAHLRTANRGFLCRVPVVRAYAH